MAPALEIRAHLASGRTHHFVQEDPEEARGILGEIRVGQVFHLPQLTIAGEYSMSFLSGSAVNRLDFLTEVDPGWSQPIGIRSASVVTEEAFLKGTGFGPEGVPQRRVRGVNAGEELTMWARLEFLSGQRLYLEMQVEAQPRLDRLQRVSQVLSRHSLWAQLPEGGFTLVNMANVAVANVAPGGPEAPRDAWVMNYKKIS